ncbi:gliding motility-associated C-terminal domain-containing protein [Myroides odoratus]|uniref:gliding motility-associated C-terminal domain-containing protein n=1 Tax=Myroides odoratus TaxID=256 RepID=UPI00216904AB|nr:gliding motility-associated C-terminal domain-containing protein [Myroides odoratus]MCS4239653.1 gliding motility-associated-like protein [Myroides odoratus]
MKYFSLLILLITSNLIYSQRINPEDVTNLCSNEQLGGQTPPNSNYTNLRTSCGPFNPLSSSLVLYYVEIESGSTFTFRISPNAPVDYDFASWKNPNFDNLGPADRGSQNDGVDARQYDIGLSMTETMLCEEPGASTWLGNTATVPGFVRYYDVQPGDGILIAVNRWSDTDAGFTISFDGNANAVLNCDFDKKTYEQCDENYDNKEIFDLDLIKEDINNSEQTFIIDFFEDREDAKKTTSTNVLSSPYTVKAEDNPKQIYARFKRANGNFLKTLEIELVLNEVPKKPKEPLKYALCVEELKDKEKIATFNLTRFENKLSENNIGKIDFTYFEPFNDTIRKISNPTKYSSMRNTITIRMTIDDKCPIDIPLQLVVNDIDIKSTAFTYSELCATETETGLVYDLNQTVSTLLSNKDEIKYNIHFFNSPEDAESETNAIEDPSNHLVPYYQEQLITVKITDNNTCSTQSEIRLHAVPRFRMEDQVTTECTPYRLPELPEGYAYYLESNNQGNNIKLNTPESIFYGPKTIYIYAKKDYGLPKLNDCTFEDSFTVTTEGCIIAKGISPNGDGLNDNWDLTPYGVINLRLFNRNGIEVYKKTGGYTNEWYGQSNGSTKLPSGTYWYYFEAITGVYSGWIELMY